jgi:hypothetical protein
LDLNPKWFDSNGRAGRAIDVQRRVLCGLLRSNASARDGRYTHRHHSLRTCAVQEPLVIANACLLPVESKAFASALVHSGLDVSHVREILAD